MPNAARTSRLVGLDGVPWVPIVRAAVGPADPSTFGKEVVGTVLENVTISYCSRVAGYFRGDGLVIRNSLISDTSTEGIYVIGSSDVLLERNIIRRNNIEQFTGYYPAAVKIFNQTRRVTCRDNLVIDNPHSNGIWYDVGNRDGVFVDNWIENAQDGFFFEISRGAIVAGNLFVRALGVHVGGVEDADALVAGSLRSKEAGVSTNVLLGARGGMPAEVIAGRAAPTCTSVRDTSS